MGMRREIVAAADRFLMTTWIPDDIEDLYALHADPLVMRYIGGETESREQSEERLSHYLDQQAARGWTKWRLADRGGSMIGRAGCGIYRGHRELGYTLRRDVWGHGIGTEVARELVTWHHDNPDSTVDPALVAFTEVDHSASRRVLMKSGFTFIDERAHAGTPIAYYEYR